MKPKEYGSQDKSPESRAATAARFRTARQVDRTVEFGGRGQPPVEIRGVVRDTGNAEQQLGIFHSGNRLRREALRVASMRIRESKAAISPVEETALTHPLEARLRVVSLGEGSYAFELITHGVEVTRETFVEATAEYLATVFGDPLFAAATKSWHTESDPVTATADAMEVVSEWLRAAMDRPLQGLGTALGLSPGEAAFTAGVSTNLILAPITGPLDNAESYLEIAGIIFGLLTGGHALVLACIKPLLHSQVKHLAVHGAVKLLGGSRTDRPRPPAQAVEHRQLARPDDAPHTRLPQALIQPMPRHPEQYNLLRPPRSAMPRVEGEAPRRSTPAEPLWLCLAFAPTSPPNSDAARAAAARTVEEREATKPVVLPLGDDAFLKTLPAALRRGNVTEVEMPTARTLSHLPRGQRLVLNMGGAGLGTSSGNRDPQDMYQHPGCLTGRCVPPGGPPCLCQCSVCRPDRLLK